MKSDYSKKYVLQVINELIEGTINSMDAAIWADKIESDENSNIRDKMMDEDPALYQLVSDISNAGPVNPEGDQLYGKEDYMGWLHEYLENSKK